MSAAWMLNAAQFGVNLLQFGAARRGAKAQAGLATAQAQLAGTMERIQLERAGRIDARNRTERLAQTIGSQRVAMGAAGVAGGRTARLIEARSQVQRRFAQDVADTTRQDQIRASEYRQRSAISGIRQQATAARTQATMNLLGSAVSAGQQSTTLLQQDRALA